MSLREITQRIIPEDIRFTYIAFLENYDKVAAAIEEYYSDPNGFKRTKLLQEIARPQTGGLAERISKANGVLDKILDHYNTTQKIIHEDVEVDIDIDGEIIEKFVFRNGKAVIEFAPEGLVKRIK